MQASLLDLETALITRRTVVRRFRENEGAAFYALYDANAQMLQDLLPEVLPPLPNPTEAECFVRRQLSAWLIQEALSFAIWDKESAQLIGYVCLTPTRSDWHKAQLTGFIHKAHQNMGLMSEVIHALLYFAFIKVRLKKVVVLSSVENVAAQRMARKCGFLREGDLREEFHRPSGEPVDALLFGISSTTYEKA